jgi:transposase
MPDRRTERELNDRLWERVRPLLPLRPEHPKGGRPFADDRACFEGILSVLRNGCRWRALDVIDAFPSGVTCWRRHRDWTRAGVWARVWRIVLDELDEAGLLDTSEFALDATFVEAKKGGPRSGKPSAARA